MGQNHPTTTTNQTFGKQGNLSQRLRLDTNTPVAPVSQLISPSMMQCLSVQKNNTKGQPDASQQFLTLQQHQMNLKRQSLNETENSRPPQSYKRRRDHSKSSQTRTKQAASQNNVPRVTQKPFLTIDPNLKDAFQTRPKLASSLQMHPYN